MPVLVRQLHRSVHFVAVHDGLLLGQLRAHVPALGQLHDGLLERQLPDLLRGRDLQRRLLVGPLQHLVSKRRDVYRLVLERRMRPRVRGRGYVLLLELLLRRMLLHGGWLSLTDERHSPPPPQPPELQATHVPASRWHVTLPAVQVPWQQACPRAPQLPQLPFLQTPPPTSDVHIEPEAAHSSSAQQPPLLHVRAAQQGSAGPPQAAQIPVPPSAP
jgi:hypothetical protein